MYCIEEREAVYTNHTSDKIDDSAMNIDQQEKHQSYPCPPSEERIPSWSFLLDNVSVDVDVDELRVDKVVRDGNGYYEVMALAGKDVLEWRIH